MDFECPLVFFPYFCGKYRLIMVQTDINVNGRLLGMERPRVMGILNVTPDSFFSGSRAQTEADIRERVKRIVDEGADIIDVGAYSSRPGADDVSAEEEMRRLRSGLAVVREVCPDAVVSVDTFRADVARMCVEEFGVGIINDISGGTMDEAMFPTVAHLGVPYVLMHMQGTPQTMQTAPHYDDVTVEVMRFFAERIQRLQDLGQKDIILDPGFGFGKTLEHNYELLSGLDVIREMFSQPILVGVSRKSMIYRLLDTTPEDSLAGTIAVNTIALMKGANILRVHDVKEAVETVKIVMSEKFKS